MTLIKLEALKDTARPRKACRRVGRGPGSCLGKTCGRGQKGQGARSGYKRRYGNEGGQVPLYRKMPTRGFSNARFAKRLDAVNLAQIDALFSDGETVSVDSLRDHGLISGTSHGVKILGEGEIATKVTLEVTAVSAGAKQKLEKAGVEIRLVG